MSGMQTREITIHPASDVPLPELVRALNLAYSDYYVPISHTPASFETLVAYESIRLSSSAAAVIGQKVVGMGLLGVRGLRGWIGGVGVVPQYRSQGIGRMVMEFLIHQGRALDLQRLQLEVITQNTTAHRLYLSLGFADQRKLLVLYRTGYEPVPALSEGAASLSIRRADPAAALDALPALVDLSRPWQREAEGMRPMVDRLRAASARDAAGTLIGLAVYRVDGSQISIRDIAAAAPEAGEALLAYVLNTSRESHASYINVGENESLVPDLLSYGFSETLSQYEMFLPLSAEAA